MQLDLNLLDQTRLAADALLNAENAVRSGLFDLCEKTWELGEKLAALKQDVGASNFATCVGANLPQLGGDEDTRAKRAAAAIAFHAANPEFPSIREFCNDSIRKCVFGLAPEKERPLLEGDAPIAPAPHPLTFVNNFWKWDRQANLGHIARLPVPVLRRDFEPVLRRIVELTGKDWVEGVIGEN